MTNDRADLTQKIEAIAGQMAEQAGDNAESLSAMLSLVRSAGIIGLADPAQSLTAARLVGHYCTPTAWLMARHDEALRLISGLAPEVRQAVGDGLIIMAEGGDDCTFADGKLGGTLPAVGGLTEADWLLICGVADNKGTKMAVLVPVSSLFDTSPREGYFGGLRGLGFRPVAVDGIAVSDGFAAPLSGLGGLGADHLFGALIGAAEGGSQDYVRMTRARITGIGGFAVVRFAQVQERLAESDAELRCATALFDMALARIAGGAPADAGAHRDRAYAARLGLNAVTRLVRQMGAMGLAETNPVQRRYRDLRAIVADPAFAWDDGMARFGRQLLGVPEMEMQAAS